MQGIIIKKNQLPGFIDQLIRTHKVYAPMEKEGLTCYGEIKSSSEINTTFQSKVSSKEVLFPRCEPLFSYELSDEDIKLQEPQVNNKQAILFGVPPCEVSSFTVIDNAFTLGEFHDIYYLRRRENTIIVGKSCVQPRNTCFCTSVGGSPFKKEGFDLLLHDLGNRYLLEVISEKGGKLIDELEEYEDATQADIEEAERLGKAAEEKITKLDLQGIEDKLEKMFNNPLWNTIHLKCIGCGICTYLCPTCYCFDIVDELKGSKGKRVRIWDSCQFPLFTLQGSGENPRPSGKERMRQRVMHKFYYYPKVFKNYGDVACVGCGRCVRECPVNLDIRNILKMIMVR